MAFGDGKVFAALISKRAVTGDQSLRELIETERMHAAIVRRLDDTYRVLEV
jgi:hypothetical protein